MADEIHILDAAGSNIDGTSPGSPLSIGPGTSYPLVSASFPAAPLNVLYASSIDTEGEIPVTRRYGNRTISLRLGVDEAGATLRRPHREVVQVLEHKPARELVAAKDIVRTDHLGRTVVACPAGQAPAHWLNLTRGERAALIEPPPPVPQGHMHRSGAYGFSPEGVAIGRNGFVEEPPW